MVNYKNGKIYQVYCLGQTEIYIGSTSQPALSTRLGRHKTDYNTWKKTGKNKVTLYNMFDKYGVENCIIELIELWSCDSKLELRAREGHHQRLHLDTIVNKRIECRTIAEWKQDNMEVRAQKYQNNREEIQEKCAQYYQDNREVILENQKQYYKDNVVAIEQYRNQYYKDNVDVILARNKQYRQDNAEEIRKKEAEKFTCVCGSIGRHSDKARHEKTIKHQKYLETLKPTA
jgi:hypothetical protein